MNGRRIARFMIVFVVALAFAAPSVLAGQAQLRSDLQLLDASDQGVVVLVSLTNASNEDVFVLSYETALKGIEKDLFRVERDGEVIPYEGAMIVRIGPLAESWMRIGAGQTLSGKVNLSNVYDLSRGGTYSIEYMASQHVMSGVEESMLPVASADEGKSAVLSVPRTMVRSEAISFEFAGADILVDSALVAPVSPELAKDSFPGCSSSERSQISAAKSNSRPNVRGARDYCNAYGSGSGWYSTWFGGGTYVSTVCQNFADAYNVLGSNSFTFTCTNCDSGVIAYVYKNRPYEIWICPDFFTYTYFQTHAVTHEVFHWYIVAGAEDWTYGSANCQTLASSYHPYYAATNADNYAYAADNSPW